MDKCTGRGRRERGAAAVGGVTKREMRVRKKGKEKESERASLKAERTNDDGKSKRNRDDRQKAKKKSARRGALAQLRCPGRSECCPGSLLDPAPTLCTPIFPLLRLSNRRSFL